MQLTKRLFECFPRLGMAFLQARESWRSHEAPRDTPMGFRFAGHRAMQRGEFEPEETGLVMKLLPHVDVVINIGANIGYYCCIALRENKKVVAFEPMAENLQFLMRNIKANSWGSQIEVYPLALSDKVGIVEIYGGGTAASLVKGWAGTPDRYVSLVPSTTLDNVLAERFRDARCLILVDIEGAELPMLDGAAAVIDRAPRPVWMMEISVSEHQPGGTSINPNLVATFARFWDAGYEAWTADRQCRIVVPDEIHQIANTGIDTLHTHNFLFVAEGTKTDQYDL